MCRSLSARRAWIEIYQAGQVVPLCAVALRKESVDRNIKAGEGGQVGVVALRKESVDRNSAALAIKEWDDGRSPQGERG